MTPVTRLPLLLAGIAMTALSAQAHDINNDGYDDLVIGSPMNQECGPTDCGGVAVMYGRWTGVGNVTTEAFHANTPGVDGSSNSNEHFGEAVAVGDFDNDGFADVAVGIPGDTLGTSLTNAGSVHIFMGSSTGVIGPVSDTVLFQGLGGVVVEGALEAGDRFGESLTVGDFNNDGRDDLLVGVPGQSSGGGAVHVFYGSSTGLSTSNDSIWNEARASVLGTRQPGDAFGEAITACDVDNDGYDDAIIGVPNQQVGSAAGAGKIHVLFGGPLGINGIDDEEWHQNSPGVPHIAQATDGFGSAVSCADYNADGFADVAIGVPYEDFGGVTDTGLVQVIGGSSGGLAPSALMRNLRLGNVGFGLSDEAGANFGASLESGNYNGDRTSATPSIKVGDLAIGAPNMSDSGTPLAGGVVLLAGSITGTPLVVGKRLLRGDPGISGSVLGSSFGSALATGDWDGDGFDDLAVSAPYDSPQVGGVTRAFAGTIQYFLGSGSVGVYDGGRVYNESDADPTASLLNDMFGMALD